MTLKGSVAVMSVQQKVGGSSPTTTPVSSRPASVEKVDFYTVIPHMSSPKCATGTGNFDGRLLVCGGYDRGECLRTVEEYNPDTNTWIEQPHMRQCRGRFDLTVLDGKAYAVGGCDGSRELSTVEVLGKNSKKWSTVAPLPLARSNTGETTNSFMSFTTHSFFCCFAGEPEKSLQGMQWSLYKGSSKIRRQVAVSLPSL